MRNVNLSTIPVPFHRVQATATSEPPPPRPQTPSLHITQASPWSLAAILVLSVLQMILMVLNVAWEIVLWENLDLHVIGVGIMSCFALLGIAIGCVGIGASCRRSHKCMHALMTLAIISAVFLPFAIIMYIIALAVDKTYCPPDEQTGEDTVLCLGVDHRMTSSDRLMYTLLFMCLSGAMLIAIIISVWAGYMRNTCCKRSTIGYVQTTQVLYTVPVHNGAYQPQLQTVNHIAGAAPTLQPHAQLYSTGNPPHYSVTQGRRSSSGKYLV